MSESHCRVRDGYYAFEAGRPYPQQSAVSAKDYLDSALRAEKGIRRYRRQADEGLYWLHDDEDGQVGAPDVSFYHGVAGIAYFYLLLFRVTGDARFAAEARSGGNYAAAHWRDVLDAPQLWLTPEYRDLYRKGSYFGVSGVGTVLLDLYRQFADDRYLSAIREIIDYYRDTARQGEAGIRWTNTGIAFDGGVILFLVDAYREASFLWPEAAEELLDLIRSASEEYLARGHRTSEGGLLYHGFEGILDYDYPNFTYGAAGSGYVLTVLYELFGDERYLQGAKDCAAYLESIAVPQGKGYLLRQRQGEGQPTVLCLNVCNGPAGTARLFYRLAALTGDHHYRDQIVQLVDGLESQGAPDRQAVGLWNNACLCCGHAGLLEFFIGLYVSDNDSRWHDLAERCARILLAWEEQDEDGASDWPGAWERIHPEHISRGIGYFDGSAGIAASLLQAYELASGDFTWNRLNDDPFPNAVRARRLGIG